MAEKAILTQLNGRVSFAAAQGFVFSVEAVTMRRVRASLALMAGVLLGLIGCLGGSTRPELKPDHVEEFHLPSPSAGRFSRPEEYPKEFLNQQLPKKDPNATDKLPPPQPGGGSMAPAMQSRPGNNPF
jgi:hypothetical protein